MLRQAPPPLLLQDWAFVEDFCRRLTGQFSDVYVFTVPLYLPRKEIDGKWRVVSGGCSLW